MNNLDRTNVVQSLIARRSVVFQLDKADKEDDYPLERTSRFMLN